MFTSTIGKSRATALLGLFLLLAAVPAWSQSTTGTIVGTVSDPSGGVLPGASVTARNVATNIERSVTTDEDGFYRIGSLPPGTYELRVEAPGFKREVLQGVELQMQQILRMDASLQVGNVSEEVVVTAEAPLVETNSVTIGDVIENKRILDMPLNGRNFLQLSLLQAGTVTDQEGSTQGFFGTATGGLGFVVAGGRDDQNHVALDGIIAMDYYFSTPSLMPSVDAVQEFKLLKNSFPAEYGMYFSGHVSVTTKSGTNDIHGGVFEFHRNHIFDAGNFFDLPGRDIPKLVRNQFGGTVGGPIKEDQTFFFLSYEGLRERKSETRRSALPTADQRTGLFVGELVDPDPLGGNPFTYTGAVGCETDPLVDCTSTQIPAVRFGTVADFIVNNFLPAPNQFPNLVGLNHISVGAKIEDRDQLLFRIDHQISQKHMFFGRYLWATSDQSFPFGDNILTFDPAPPPGFPTDVPDDSQNLAIGVTSVIGPSLINELRGGWNFYDGKRLSGNRDIHFAADVLGLAGVTIAERDRGLPNFHVAGLSQFGDADVFNPLFRKNSTFQVSDTIAWTRGKHTFKFGGSAYFVDFDTLSNFFGRSFPNYDGVSLTGNFTADFLIDRPLAIVTTNGDTEGHSSTNIFTVFVQDEWRISPRLTMNVGLRYEIFPPITEDDNRLAVYDVNSGNIIVGGDTLPTEVTDPNGLVANYNDLLLWLQGANAFGFPVFPAHPTLGPAVTFQTSSSAGLSPSVTKTDSGNWAPRLGFAYDLTGKGRTVIRAAYGIYNAQRDWSASSDSRNMLPFALQGTLLDIDRLFGLGGSGAMGCPSLPVTFDRIYTDCNALTGNPISGVGNWVGGGIGPQVDLPIGYSQSYTLSLQHQLGDEFVIEAAYVGSHNLNLNRLTTTNQERLTGPSRAFPDDPRFGFFIQEASGASSNYNSGFIRVEKRLSKGLMFVASHTWAKSIDTVSSARENGGAPTRAQDAFCLECERALSNFDVRNRFVTSFTYELPIGENATGAAEKMLKGWQIGGIISAQSGQPFTPQWPGGAPPGNRFPRPSITPSCDPNLSSGQRTPNAWFDASCFFAPNFIPEGIPFGIFTAFPGNAGRNSLEGPGLAGADFNLQKNTTLREGLELQFRAEVFNALNKANFNLPDRVFVAGGNPNFGQITSARDARVFQFGLKLMF